MHWKIRMILILVPLTTERLVNAWPQCAEFRFRNNDSNLNTDEKRFKQRIPTLFESYDSGNYSGVERTLKLLESLRVADETFQRQESATLKTVSIEFYTYHVLVFVLHKFILFEFVFVCTFAPHF